MSQQVYLLCKNNHIFPSGFAVSGTVKNLSLQDNFSACTFCGLSTPWPNGSYDFIGGIFQKLTSSSDPVRDAKELLSELEAYRDDAKQQTPIMNDWFPNLTSNKKWVITTLIALLSLVVAANSKPDQNQIIFNYNITILEDQQGQNSKND